MSYRNSIKKKAITNSCTLKVWGNGCCISSFPLANSHQNDRQQQTTCELILKISFNTLKTKCTQITVKINYAEYAAKCDDVTASLNTFPSTCCTRNSQAKDLTNRLSRFHINKQVYLKAYHHEYRHQGVIFGY